MNLFATPSKKLIRQGMVLCRPIDYATAKKVVIENHYSGLMPSSKLCLGFYIEGQLNAVIVFGIPGTSKMKASLPTNHYWELSRLFSFDWAEKNMESHCIGLAVAYVKKHHPDIKLLISFADPEHGHGGTIYQATNWLYCGLTAQAGNTVMVVDGKKIHPRTLNHRYGTTNKEELKRLFPDAEFSKMSRKHRYIMLLGNRRERAEMKKNLKYEILPYPKPTQGGKSDE